MFKGREKLARILFMAAAGICIVAVALICIFLFANGLPAIGKIGVLDFLLGRTWKPKNDIYGIFPMILGSIYVTAGALVLGAPIGLLTAIYLAKFSSKRVHRILRPAVELLAGIPSVVYGFFGLVVIVPFVREAFGGNGSSMLTASIILAIMILPTIVTISEAAIRAVPESYYEGALALGASHEHSVFSVVVPAAGSGITASLVLGMGRAVGET
ncbi:MAG: phosphate ABC transporter permease subunit PstC, partial [Bacillota bacterium]